MSKYSNEFKLKVVKYCIEGHHGFKSTADYFNIPAKVTVQKWCRKYEEHGEKGLLKNFKTSYSGEFKQSVVEYMHTNHLSSFETAIHFNLANDAVVSKWERIYYEEGPQALYEERRGRKRIMSSKTKKKELSKGVEEDLIAENQRLRMENAYLKKLQALIQERTQPKQPRK